MKRIYYLSTCDTCRKILAQINTEGVELINIREHLISKEDLMLMRKSVGSYELLFNKRAQKLKEMSEDQKPKKETDYKRLILSEYTFMKRPAAIIDEQIIVGNDKKAVEKLLKLLSK
ncbi:MAG: ArsC/Spx/MgsR family protein [Saprospiraceae bacterium]